MTIKGLRESRSFTQQEVANYVGITLTSYARIERGEAVLGDCKYKTVKKLVQILGKEILEGVIMDKEEIKRTIFEADIAISLEEKYINDYNATVSVCVAKGQRINLYRYAVKNGASYIEKEFSEKAVDSFIDLARNVSEECYVYEQLDAYQIVIKKWGCIHNLNLDNVQGYKVYSSSLSASDIFEIKENGFVIKDA